MRIEHDVEGHRFYVELPAGTAQLAYAPAGDGVLEFYSTFVPDAARGQGIAAALVEAGIGHVRKSGQRVIPTCWYVAKWLRGHPEHADLVAG